MRHEVLEKDSKLLCERVKLIEIADRSEFSWGVVTEYTADELVTTQTAKKAVHVV